CALPISSSGCSRSGASGSSPTWSTRWWRRRSCWASRWPMSSRGSSGAETAMALDVQVRDLTLRYGRRTTALDRLSLTLDGGKIYGLIGRNGSGKTSLLSVLAAFRRASSGEVLVGGENPYENERITRQICLIRESGDVLDYPVHRVLDIARRLRPHWDQEY